VPRAMGATGAVHARQGLRAQVSPHGARDAGRYCDCLLAAHTHMSRDEESKSHSTTSAAEPAMGADQKRAPEGRMGGARGYTRCGYREDGGGLSTERPKYTVGNQCGRAAGVEYGCGKELGRAGEWC
jgi:hypothetical protein